ncbi:ABC transporter ATP-binding protein [Radicibacter daui]|uniref:ABC transporter ATP-binding protein n=1 Tax=Radicibacter daui TaxID=3064829 RepID=UPI0040468A2C
MRILLDRFTKRFGDTTVIEDMTLEVADGEMLALLGPSGCGKSTTLFSICGLHRVDGGRVLFGDRDVSGLPAQERNVGVVFQSYALYPHLTVAENIGFPLRVRHEAADAIRRQVGEMAELLQIENLLARRPAALSGGQQQRVALARALIRRPEVLLLDEPLANLDAKLRLEMRSEIRRLQRETGTTAILVTHDQVEAMSMCDRIALMRGGKIVQIGQPEELYANPVSDFAAGFLGNPPISFVDGLLSAGRFTSKGGWQVALPTGAMAAEEPIRIGIRPEYLQPEVSGPAVPVSGRISFVERQGRENLYDLTLTDGSVLRSVQPARDDVRPGDDVIWQLRADRVLMFDQTGSRL